ncbi:MAG: hypothetical protein QOG43_167 [Actinomycetota bacterium]|nr:hypothetical protein [Actinomycetota bacterium]
MATHIELIRTKALFALVRDTASTSQRRVSIEEADLFAASGAIVPTKPEEFRARRKVEALLIETRKLEAGHVKDDLFAEIRATKREFPLAFHGEPRIYETQVGWILRVVGGTEEFAPVYLDIADRAGVLAALDSLSRRGYEVVHVSEERALVEGTSPSSQTTTSTEIVGATYLLRRP